MFLGCQGCQANGGSCSEHPRVKCSDCGLEYTDDDDWSGPAHSDDACKAQMNQEIRNLKNRLEAEGAMQGHEKPCSLCGEPCSCLAGDPGQWPVYLGNDLRFTHAGCVLDQIHTYRSALEAIDQWDCLNMPDSPRGVSDLCDDFPWLKKLVNDALKAGEKK